MIGDVQHTLYGAPAHAKMRLTKAEFLRWTSDDNYAYEFNDGLLEPTLSMRQDGNYLLTNLEDCFFKTAAFQRGDRLRPEMDIWLTETQMRRPDVSYFTRVQLQQMTINAAVVPPFVVEFASESDSEQKSIRKLHDYFEAGVQVVWWVYPIYREVYVYSSPKSVAICTDDDPLDAAPVIPDLRMTAADLFRLR